MGRNARRRAEKKEEAHAHGIEPDPAEQAEKPVRCPKCGSTNLFIGRTHAMQFGYQDVICGNCSWQGEIPIQGWA
jgi:predicted RNA-binding Zn-ribbon protein involved in translation (DUF1610 family)